MKNKKILYISASFINDSGCAVIAENTRNLFNNEEFTSEIFTTKNYCFDVDYKFAYLFPEEINTVKKYVTNIFKYYYNWSSEKQLEKLISQYQPDLVHIHSLRTPAMTYSLLKPVIKRNIPIVMTLHDSFLICPMMTLVKGNGKQCVKVPCKGYNKFHCIFNHCGKNIEQSFRLAMMSFVNKMTGFDKMIDKFITPSNALKELMLAYNKDITKDKIITINNFLSKSEFGDITPNYQNKGYFLYIGRLDKVKGVNYLLEALSSLSRDIQIHIIGKGTDEYLLKQYVADNNLNNVKFLGFKSREEIKSEYKNCIATILPCNWFENFPTTNMESFIYGKPVIASNIGGISEQVEHNKTGLLFEPANIEQLKECILKYWQNPNIAVVHGKNAYKKATTQYTEERYYKDLKKIYTEVLK